MTKDTLKAIHRAAREMHRGMPKGGPIASKKDKNRRRNKKHVARAKGAW
jgi:hypothetical protein